MVIKAALLGSVSAGVAARDLSVDAGIPVRIDGPWGGPISNATALHLAVGAPPDMLVSGTDVTSPLVIDDDWGAMERPRPGRLAPVDAPGHGVRVPDSYCP